MMTLQLAGDAESNGIEHVTRLSEQIHVASILCPMSGSNQIRLHQLHQQVECKAGHERQATPHTLSLSTCCNSVKVQDVHHHSWVRSLARDGKQLQALTVFMTQHNCLSIKRLCK